MNTKHQFISRLILLASLIFVACSSDDEDGRAYTLTAASEIPDWHMDWTFDQARPDWQEPESAGYENWMVMLVKIEETLQQYSSSDDLMAIFVGDEIRGMASPAVDVSGNSTGKTSFLIKAYAGEISNERMDITLKYYNAKLRHVFSHSASIVHNLDEVFGISNDFIPDFTLGSAKYPVVMKLALDATPLAKADVTPKGGNMVAAFVGDECRGVMALENGLWKGSLTVFGREQGEKVSLKYYDSEGKRILTFPNVVITEKQPTIVTTLE